MRLALLCLAACGTVPHAERFGDGVFSTELWDFFVAFTPDGSDAMVCRADDSFTHYQLLETRRRPDGTWSPPAEPAFAAGFSTADPHISPDGKTVYFISNRPPSTTYDIYRATLGPDGVWGAAQFVPIDAPAVDKWSPSIAASGNLYFGAELPGTHGHDDIWVARRDGDHYLAPENLGPAINTAAGEVEPWIAPDESYLIFAGFDGHNYDLYLSRRDGGTWQRARPITAVNTADWSEWNPSVSPDGRWLYFTRSKRGGRGDIFRVSTAAL